MNEPITVGAIVLTVSLAALFAAARAWPAPGGRHRAATATPAAERTRHADLMPDWPEPVYGAAVPQAIAHCRGCRGVTSVVLHPGGGHTCTEGHTTHPGGR